MKQSLKTRIQKLVYAVPESQLVEMTQEISYWVDKRNKKIITRFEVGDEVSWTQNKTTLYGTIVKIHASSASVKTIDNWQYNVPAYLLKKERYIKS